MVPWNFIRLIAWSYSVSSSSASLPSAIPFRSNGDVDRGCKIFVIVSLGSLRGSSSTSRSSLPATELVDRFSSDVVLLLVFMLRSIGLSWCTVDVDEEEVEAGETSALLRFLISTPAAAAFGVVFSFCPPPLPCELLIGDRGGVIALSIA